MIGSFEKLGILVIVVIIVMILAIAIYQWGGAGLEPAGYGPVTAASQDGPLERDLEGMAGREPALRIPPEPPADPSSIPAEYVIQPNDNLWTLVRKWGLKDSFIEEIRKANPSLDARSLVPGQTIKIPSSEGARVAPPPSSSPAAESGRTYQVQEGDDLSTIARKHLGSARRYREILQLNPGLDARRLRIGQTIRLPAN
ncbi:MAG: LysM peptidoglycan-binding domain-containing protein [Planctomycetaceae bacterium]